MMHISLEGKNAVVCGSSDGIGKATAIEMSKLGAKVILLARDEEKLRQVMQLLDTSYGQQHVYIVADFSKPDELKSKVIARLGDISQIHILVNNSGGPAPGLAHEAEPRDYIAAFNQHLVCNQILVQQVMEKMKKAGYGRVINIISTSVKQPLPNLGVSNTIRGAVGNWAKTLSRELAPFGITVNNVLPGATQTGRLSSIIGNKSKKTGIDEDDVKQEMISEIPAGRFGLPEEVAWAACFLAGPAAAYINGVNIPVDGGRTGCL